MAIFWKHIKGTNKETVSTDTLWTWIEFSTKTLSSKQECLPIIKINTTDNENTANNLGHLITSNAEGQSINKVISTKGIKNGSSNLETDTLQINNSGWSFKNQGDIWFKSCLTYGWFYYMDEEDLSNKDGHLTFNSGKGTGDALLILRPGNKNHDTQKYDYTTMYFQIKEKTKKLAITDGNTFEPIITFQRKTETDSSAVVIKNKCEALYFNATSDKRAKDNIMPIQESALEIVNHLPLYTFNYKSQPDQKVVGVIAQDLLDKELDGVSFVDNKNATGTDGDYMTVKESKLVYLLLKAVQEQQKEIDELKKQLESR